jgi:hypothetical protein
VLKDGFTLNDRVIRPAHVGVVRAPPKPKAAPAAAPAAEKPAETK